jgi:mRNA interferase RelE/StbE
MKILQTNAFEKAVKKLHKNQKKDLDAAIKTIIDDYTLGEEKLGDLAGVRVYKFKMNKQLTLLAYTFQEKVLILTLLALGSHQNFYTELKRL